MPETFIRVIEYWVPSEDGSLLEFGGGLFGSAKRFFAATQKLIFGRGEGLPGQAWETGHPIVLNDLEGSYFRRATAARAEGLTSGIALPIFKGEALSAVVVIFCGDDADHAGAIELWCNDPKESKDMSLVDGYYGTTGDTFEFISRSTSFRRGNGLPGMAWQNQTPVFLEDLGKGSGFLRADGAIKVGINRGFAVPCSTIDGTHYVMAFLSALATPIANQVEIWSPDAHGGAPVRSFGFSEIDGRLPGAEAASVPAGQIAAIAQAFATGTPVVLEPMIAIPIAPQGRITAVMALHF
ncbi:GAF domain-containing protein [Burkholderiales bacterium 8X]|nr:GAF domain-containing protein [Burkholderiales bacterium 8X]